MTLLVRQKELKCIWTANCFPYEFLNASLVRLNSGVSYMFLTFVCSTAGSICSHVRAFTASFPRTFPLSLSFRSYSRVVPWSYVSIWLNSVHLFSCILFSKFFYSVQSLMFWRWFQDSHLKKSCPASVPKNTSLVSITMNSIGERTEAWWILTLIRNSFVKPMLHQQRLFAPR